MSEATVDNLTHIQAQGRQNKGIWKPERDCMGKEAWGAGGAPGAVRAGASVPGRKNDEEMPHL